MKNKILILFTFICIAAFALGITSASAGTYGGYTYTVSNGEVEITSFNKTVTGAIEIPSEIDGYPVRRIDAYAFSNCSGITSVSIPDSITYIDGDAFYQCASITDIYVDENNEYYSSIDGNLFSKDKKTLIRYAVGKAATSYIIPAGVTTIESDAFYYCTNLISIELPDGFELIEGYSFYGCDNLTTIIIPDSVTAIENQAFYMCKSLANIDVDENNEYYCSIDGNLFSKDKTTLVQYAVGKAATSYTIPSGVTTIGSGAFRGCKNLTSITIPDNVTAIENQAFYMCDSLANIDVDENNEYYSSIDGNLFSKDKKTLMQYAMGKTTTSYTIPDGVTTIGSDAFDGCKKLTSITFPDSFTSIDGYIFSDCTNLENINISNGVTYITSTAFYTYSGSVANINVDEDNEYYSSIDGNLFSKDKKTLVWYAVGKTATSYAIPAGVTTIGERAFDGCENLKSITIPDSVTSLGSYAFYDCYSLESITIPGSVTSIEGKALYYCYRLTNINVDENNEYFCTVDGNLLSKDKTTLVRGVSGDIPDGVTTIGSYAFEAPVYNLEMVIIPKSVTSIEDYAFYSCYNLENVYYAGSESDWANMTIGSDNYYLTNANIHCNYDGNSDEYKYKYEISNNEVTITGLNVQEEEMVIPSELGGYPVTAIDSHAFMECSGITSITIPNSVTSIGEFAFGMCTSLKSITIPNSVTSIGDGAFMMCTSLETVNIPAGVENIGLGAFMICTSLTCINVDENNEHFCSVDGDLFSKDKTTLVQYAVGKPATSYTIPDSVTTIGDATFTMCPNLTSITIHDNVTYIGMIPFGGCVALTNINVDENNEYYCSVDGNLFSKDKKKLIQYAPGKTATSYVVPDGVTSIGMTAFTACQNIETVTIPNSVTSIEEGGAFDSCTNLDTVHYYGTPARWTAMVSEDDEELLSANVIFVPNTKTTFSEDGKTITVTPINVESGNTVVIALFAGDKLVETKTEIYGTEDISFNPTKEYDSVKVMVWEDLTSLEPVTQPEII